MAYIQQAKEEPSPDAGCLFCRIADGSEGERVLARDELAYVVVNRYPYNPGHLLVVTVRHVGALEEVTDAEHLALMRLVARSVSALERASEPHGFNLGMNLGRVAGAGVPDHLHWHVVPRWSGDTNFMPVLGQTRVLPELVEETRARLAPYFEGA
jgi:ATP adenylyltransferase